MGKSLARFASEARGWWGRRIRSGVGVVGACSVVRGGGVGGVGRAGRRVVAIIGVRILRGAVVVIIMIAIISIVGSVLAERDKVLSAFVVTGESSNPGGNGAHDVMISETTASPPKGQDRLEGVNAKEFVGHLVATVSDGEAEERGKGGRGTEGGETPRRQKSRAL